MPHMLVDVRLPYVFGLERDVSIQTYSFNTIGDPFDSAEDILGVLEEAYNNAHLPGLTPLRTFLADYINPPGATAEFRAIDTATGDQLGEMVTVPFGLGTVGSGPALPAEVALCMSYSASGAGPLSRRRGRVYYGPFDAGVLTADSTQYGRPTQPLIDTLCGLGAFLSGIEPTFSWRLWSRADAALKQIVGGWVDNEWDTQRRRGADPTVRTPWEVA